MSLQTLALRERKITHNTCVSGLTCANFINADYVFSRCIPLHSAFIIKNLMEIQKKIFQFSTILKTRNSKQNEPIQNFDEQHIKMK